MRKSAVISDCGRYRYLLERRWHPTGPMLPVIMLNPSTADAEVDDPTIGRVMKFARREGYVGIAVANFFAFRSTSPKLLRAAGLLAAVGPDNDETLTRLARIAVDEGRPILCAWGANGHLFDREAAVLALLEKVGARMVCLGHTASGYPRHPLYVLGDQPFEPYPWEPPADA